GSKSGNFTLSPQNAFSEDAISEDVDAVFFDADGDGSMDLIVVSGGNESGLNTPELADRLYLNDGKGNFTKSTQSGFNSKRGSSSVVQVLDLNQDGAP
ncbi:FG-GAP-like repeat-containing protein, partial [Campylobacter fetus subsp. venerealis]